MASVANKIAEGVQQTAPEVAKELAEAMAPIHTLLRDVLDDVARAGLVDGLDLELMAGSLLYLLNGHIIEAAYRDAAERDERLGEIGRAHG